MPTGKLLANGSRMLEVEMRRCMWSRCDSGRAPIDVFNVYRHYLVVSWCTTCLRQSIVEEFSIARREIERGELERRK